MTTTKNLQDIPSDVIVYKTKDYKRFKFLKGNRIINKKKIAKIKEIITLEGVDILKYNPILVNYEYQIMDGQHRFVVSKELKRDVHYVKIEEFGLEGVTKINSNSSNWGVKDYLKSYCDLGKRPYQVIRGMHAEYNVNVVVLACLIMNGDFSNRVDVNEDFKAGIITMDHKDFADHLLARLRKYEKHIPKIYSRVAIDTFLRLEKSDLFEHDYMLEKFRSSKQVIEEFASVKDMLQQLETIANYRTHKRVFLLK